MGGVWNSKERIHTAIIDCSPIGFMDAVGVKTMQEVSMSGCGTFPPNYLNQKMCFFSICSNGDRAILSTYIQLKYTFWQLICCS